MGHSHFNYLVSTCLLICKPVSGPEKLSMNVYKTTDTCPTKFELIFLLSIILLEPRREKTCLWGFRPGKTNRPVQLQRLARGWKFWI